MRRCRTTDLRRVLTIERASFGAQAWPREDFVELLGQCPGLFRVGVLDGRVAGYISGWVMRDAAEILSIAVLPRCRGRGIAATLLRATLAALRRSEVRQCRLMVRPGNRSAIRLYRTFGFIRVRRVKGYYGPRADALRMRLAL